MAVATAAPAGMSVRRRVALTAVATAVLVVAGLAAWALPSALGARTQLARGAQDVERGRTLLLEGKPQQALERFESAQERFARGAEALDETPLRWAGAVPIVGRNVATVRAISASGAQVAGAAATVTYALVDLPDGLGALAPRRGQVPLDVLERLAAPLDDADQQLAQASATFAAAPSQWLVGPVARARARFASALDEATTTVSAGHALTRALPAFLGADGVPRRYFFGAQNPAELRGTGGLIGAYAILTAVDGRLELGGFAPVQDLPNVEATAIAAPDPSYAARYDRFGGAGFWLNLNMTPDFPTAALAIEGLYERVTGERLDGAVVADPFALAALLELTGTVEVPNVGTVNSDALVPLLSSEAYARFDDPEVRKRALGDVANSVLQDFLAKGARRRPVRALRAVAGAAGDGHLLLHARAPELQDALVEAGVTGRLGASSGDFLAVVANNAGGNKVDFWAQRELGYEVRLLPDGRALSETTVALRNDAPVDGYPRYVLGPTSAVEAGESLTYLSVYRQAGTQLGETDVAGAHTDVEQGEELGHPVVATALRLPSGDTGRLTLESRLPTAWNGDDGGGRYALTVQGQTTLRETPLSVTVVAPPGMAITATSPAMEVDGPRAQWEGTTADVQTFEVRFGRSAPERAWRSVRRWFDRPVVRLGGPPRI
jgi:hypothetical protein